MVFYEEGLSTNWYPWELGQKYTIKLAWPILEKDEEIPRILLVTNDRTTHQNWMVNVTNTGGKIGPVNGWVHFSRLDSNS